MKNNTVDKVLASHATHVGLIPSTAGCDPLPKKKVKKKYKNGNTVKPSSTIPLYFIRQILKH